MEYRTINNTVYIRIDKGEQVLETIRFVCKTEHILGGHFQGIGACDTAILSTYIPEKAGFIDPTLSGMIEMVSLMGNVSADDAGSPVLHSHAVFSYLKDNGEVAVTAGHLTESRIGYTGEIILAPAGETINRMFDAKAGIDVWKLS